MATCWVIRLRDLQGTITTFVCHIILQIHRPLVNTSIQQLTKNPSWAKVCCICSGMRIGIQVQLWPKPGVRRKLRVTNTRQTPPNMLINVTSHTGISNCLSESSTSKRSCIGQEHHFHMLASGSNRILDLPLRVPQMSCAAQRRGVRRVSDYHFEPLAFNLLHGDESSDFLSFTAHLVG